MPAAHLVMYLVAGLTCAERLPETGGCWHLAAGAAAGGDLRRAGGQRRLQEATGACARLPDFHASPGGAQAAAVRRYGPRAGRIGRSLRRTGFDRNPMRRGTDRVQAMLRAGLL